MITPQIWPDQIDAHELLVQIENGRTTSTFKANEVIYSQGEEARTVFFVQDGCVEFTLSDRGIQSILGTAIGGQFFGASCLSDVAVRITSAKALTESRITSVSKDEVLSVILDRPRFAKMFTDHLWYNDAVSNGELLRRLAALAAGT